MIIRFESRKPDRPEDPMLAPVKPGLPDIRKTPNVLHLLLSIVTAGAWVLVWIGHAIANGIANGAERRSYERAMERYRQETLAWQLRWKRDEGWVPQLPE